MRGITVTLYEKTQSGTDDFGAAIYTETAVTVDNVLVAPVSGDEVLEKLNLTGKKAVYQLAIPKGNANSWENCRVSFFGQNFRVIGAAVGGIEALIPLSWNRKIMVESYVTD